MIDLLRITKSTGTYMQLVLTDPSDGYLVTDITGLEPGKATMVSTTFANAPGAQYQTSRREVRNIVFTVGLRPGRGNTVDSLRKNLYSYLMPQSKITLTFWTTELEPVKIDGVVESFEYTRFTKSPQATISILCYDPDFLALSSNTSTTVVGGSGTTINYQGTVNTGLITKVILAGSATNLSPAVSIRNTAAGEVQSFNFIHYNNLPVTTGSYLQINTNRFEKAVTLQSGTVVSSAIAYVQPFSSWIQLVPGLNKLVTTFARAGTVVQYTYTNRYGGI